jgi:hypothetical protein
MYQKFVDAVVKFKDILTTVVGFIPLVFVVIDEIGKWSEGGSQNWLQLLAAVAIAVVGWFTGKGKAKPA